MAAGNGELRGRSPTQSPSIDHGDGCFCGHHPVLACSSAKGVAQEDREGLHPIPASTLWPSKGPFHSQSPCNLLSLTVLCWGAGSGEAQTAHCRPGHVHTALSFLPWDGKPGVKALPCSFPRHPLCMEPGTQKSQPWQKRVSLLVKAGH